MTFLPSQQNKHLLSSVPQLHKSSTLSYISQPCYTLYFETESHWVVQLPSLILLPRQDLIYNLYVSTSWKVGFCVTRPSSTINLKESMCWQCIQALLCLHCLCCLDACLSAFPLTLLAVPSGKKLPHQGALTYFFCLPVSSSNSPLIALFLWCRMIVLKHELTTILTGIWLTLASFFTFILKFELTSLES